MIKEYVLFEEENVKNFNLNLNFNNYKEFIDYFYNLKDVKRVDIIFYCLIYKKYFPNIKNGNLDKIYNMYKILLNKLEYDYLNYKEKEIYEFIKAYEILCEEFENDLLFEKYCDNYLANMTRNNINKRLFLILQNIVNKLNETYDKNYKINFAIINDVASTSWFNNKFKNKILLCSETYVNFFNSKKLDDINVVATLAVQIFIILHEYRHLLQNEYMRTKNDELSKIYKFEAYTIFNSKTKKLYLNNHNSYKIECEANEYALNNFFELIKKYLKNYYIDESKLKDFLMKHWVIKKEINKKFLLTYKLLKKYLEFCEKTKYKPKELIKFNESIKS